MLVLKPGVKKVKHWTGILTKTVKKIRDDAIGSQRGTLATSTRDLLIHQIGRDDTNVMSFYMMIKPEDVTVLQNQMVYMINTFTVAARHGDFWFYRNQLKLKGMDPNLLEKPELPNINFEVPRWLVTEFTFDKVTDEKDAIEYSNPRTYRWEHHVVPRSWHNPDEAAFLLKLGIEGKRISQARNLSELAQSDKMYFRGIFEPIQGFPGSFICYVYVEDDAALVEKGIRVPGVGTKPRIKVDPKNPMKPKAESASVYVGGVTSDPFSTQAAFVCVVHGPPKITNTALPIYISFLNDTVPHERQMTAAKQIQAIPSHHKAAGVDIKALFFNDDANADDTDWLASRIDMEKYKVAIKRRPKSKTPNASQMRFILGAAEALSGFAGIQGPPGTGKTETIKTMSMAMLDSGFRILHCAPTNSAVAHLVDSFDKSCKQENWLQDHKYVLFAGAVVSMNAAEAPPTEGRGRADGAQ